MNYIIAFSSPAGSTRIIAEVIKETLTAQDKPVLLVDLDKHDMSESRIESFLQGKPYCLFAGSPVYRDMTVPPMLSFIKNISPVTGSYAVPFVTWGGAASGIAAFQMATMLMNKGFIVPAAAKVIAPHSLMRYSDEPLGKGHPDADDKQKIRDMTIRVVEGIASGNVKGLAPDTLNYPDPQWDAEMKKKIDDPMAITPKTVDEDACTSCGLCASECPAGAIELSPQPVFQDGCYDCFNCFHFCPEQAIKLPITIDQLDTRIRGRAKTMNEPPVTTIFYAE